MSILANVQPVSNFTIGKKNFIVFDADEYEREMQIEKLMAGIAEGERQIVEGKTVTIEELKKKYCL